MSDLLTGAISEIIHEALKSFAEPLTVLSGARLEDDGAGGWQEATQTSYSGLGFMEAFTAQDRLAGIPENARKIIVLANSIDIEPKPQDKVTMRGETLDIVTVDKDPAQATYTLMVK